MAVIIPAGLDGPGSIPGASRRHMKLRRRQPTRTSQPAQHHLATASAGWAGQSVGEAIRISNPASPPGTIGGAIVRAARRSAHLPRPRLARLLNVNTATLRAWENGSTSLFSVPYGQLQQLAEVLQAAGAQVGQELGELLLAAQCDLLLTGMLQGFEDYAEVPPIEGDGADAEAARRLLRWALAGVIPERYRQRASRRPLLNKDDVAFFTALAAGLQTGSHGADLVGYGRVLVALVSP
jgi:DNA-binding transcriptional regulator YiaG